MITTAGGGYGKTFSHLAWSSVEPDFPVDLREIQSPPKYLYTVGDRSALSAPLVAIVGTRHPTPYGERVTSQLAKAFAESGACVVSGMAMGVDGVAHRAALSAGGKTVAVLGTAIDKPYPASHRGLYKEIAGKGLVISEYAPGTPQFRGCFPKRNRIIAGLSKVTIVVEASRKSGALITARYALDAGRIVAAVPGSIESENSYGTNHLLRDGAQVIATVDDALSLLGLSNSSTTQKRKIASDLGPDELLVWKALETPGLVSDSLINETGLPPERCMAALTSLEIRGLIAVLLTGEIRRL